MITSGQGGFVTRMMPPSDWDCGPIPQECYDPSLSRRQIEEMLHPIYLDKDRVRKLADSDDEHEILIVKIALEILIEIDADTIWRYNNKC
jgi:hypothetical protein